MTDSSDKENGHKLPSSENFLTWHYWFGDIDTRWLAIFRILFGLIMLKDALYHLPLATVFYSDRGVIPRWELFNGLVRMQRFSLMDAFGQPWMSFLFFCAWIIVLLLLIVGYRVCWMAVLNFIIVLSIHERNGYILTGADTLMRVMCFWMMFAPIGQHYAVDVIRRRWHRFSRSGDLAELRVEDNRRAYALPVRALQWQLVMLYASTAYLKSIGEVWTSGETFHYITQIETFILPPGVWLGMLPDEILRWMSLSVMWMEFAIPILLIMPFFWKQSRAIALLLGIGLHGGIAITMSIQDFSIIILICYIPFFAPAWMDWLQARLTTLNPLKLALAETVWHPITVLLSLTSREAVQGSDTTQTPQHYDDWQVESDSGTLSGKAAWMALAQNMAFSGLWRWLLHFPFVRQFIWFMLTRTAHHYEQQPVDTRPKFWHISTRTLKIALAVILLPLLFLVALWNIDESASYRPEGFSYPAPIDNVWQDARDIVWYSGLWQYWDLFAPLPIQYDGWLVVNGQFENDYNYDLFTGLPLDFERPTRWYWGPQMRWEKYEENVYGGADALLRGWGNYYCRTLNRDRVIGTRLATLQIIMVVRDFHAPNEFPNPLRQEQLWFHWCYDEYAPQS